MLGGPEYDGVCYLHVGGNHIWRIRSGEAWLALGFDCLAVWGLSCRAMPLK